MSTNYAFYEPMTFEEIAARIAEAKPELAPNLPVMGSKIDEHTGKPDFYIDFFIGGDTTIDGPNHVGRAWLAQLIDGSGLVWGFDRWGMSDVDFMYSIFPGEFCSEHDEDYESVIEEINGPDPDDDPDKASIDMSDFEHRLESAFKGVR